MSTPKTILGCSDTFLSYIRIWREALDATNGKALNDSEDVEEFESWLSDNCRKESPWTRFNYRCRYWIRRDISRFRWDNFVEGMVCPVTDNILEYSTCHVDHVYPNTFSNIIKLFTHDFDISVDGLDFDNYKSIQDSGILYDWVDFHREFACLSIISPEANTSIIPRYINRQNDSKEIVPQTEIDAALFYSQVKKFYISRQA